MLPPRASRVGNYEVNTIGGEEVRAYIPPPLPPDPPVNLVPLQRLLEQANHAVGRLDGLAALLPSIPLSLYS